MDTNWSEKEFYEIRVKEHLAPSWSGTLDGMQILLTLDSGTTRSGEVADQADLHGLLARIRDLNPIVISVNRVDDIG